MRKFTALVFCVVALGALALAQIQQPAVQTPRSELFVGYAFQHADTSGRDLATRAGGFDVNSTNLNGFAFEFSHYWHSNFGLTVDFSRDSNGAVDSTGTEYVRSTYMAGPSYRLHKNLFLFTPSVHALAGLDHDNFTVPNSSGGVFNLTDTNFAAAGGVSFDGTLSRHLAVRVAQLDYLYTRNYGTHQSSFRYCGGVVVRF